MKSWQKKMSKTKMPESLAIDRITRIKIMEGITDFVFNDRINNGNALGLRKL